MDVQTPINGYRWSVPIPKGANLNLIRIEMLNLGAEYVWLDVLCLRQAGGWREDLCVKEWKVDVPAIGWVYRNETVACYFSGLGRPLSVNTCSFESDRSWFRRAWTLQEFCRDLNIVGDTGNNGIMEGEIRVRCEKQMSSLQSMQKEGDVFDMLSMMQKRVSTNPVNKVTGLAYLLGTGEIPAYHEMQSEEDAWTTLVGVMLARFWAELFFLYPEAGNRNKGWRPSWRQVMTESLSWPRLPWLGWVERTEESDADWYQGPCIESGYVLGLADEPQEGKYRQGQLVVEENHKALHIFKIVVDHRYLIPEGLYPLLGSEPFNDEETARVQFWVVGRRLPDTSFKKVSVFQMNDLDEVRRLAELGITDWSRTFLA